MTTSPPLEETITFPMQRALYELQRTEPKEVNLPPRPYNIMYELTPANQGRRCLSEYFRAKRFKLKKEMILYLYYLGEVIKSQQPHIEKNTNLIENISLIIIEKWPSNRTCYFVSQGQNKSLELQGILP